MAVCVFLSLQVKFVVGFGYNKYVQFADDIMKRYPQYIRLFLQITKEQEISLLSKTWDHSKVLRKFLSEQRPTNDTEAENLIKIILPPLFNVKE